MKGSPVRVRVSAPQKTPLRQGFRRCCARNHWRANARGRIGVVLAAAVVAVAALSAAPAQARVTLGYQSDNRLCVAPDQTLDTITGPANGRWIRMMVQPDRPDLFACYVTAVQGAKARGLGVFVTLMRW